jgi:hypothetical protein
VDFPTRNGASEDGLAVQSFVRQRLTTNTCECELRRRWSGARRGVTGCILTLGSGF